jgi:hypothetical protein
MCTDRKIFRYRRSAPGARLAGATCIYQNEWLIGSRSLVSHHADELGPSGVSYSLGYPVILEHVLDPQVFKGEALMGVYDTAACLMQEVRSLTRHMLMYPGKTFTLLAMPFGPLLLTRQLSLFSSKFLLALPQNP